MIDRTKTVSGLVLAGGRSTRMFDDPAQAPAVPGSRDKGLLPLGRDTMLGHVIARLQRQACPLVLNANGDPQRFAAFGLPVVADPIEGFAGPLAGILAGLKWSKANAADAVWIVSVASDTPFFPEDLVAKFKAAADSAPQRIVLARSDDGLHPVFGLWPVALADDLEAALHAGVRKVLAWTDGHDCRTVQFESVRIGNETIDPFFNANAPADLERARSILEQGRA